MPRWPELYADHNVSLKLMRCLRQRGYDVHTAREEAKEDATDPEHLRHTSEMGWVILTHNEKDFQILFDAWHRWAKASGMGPEPEHPGIIVAPQIWSIDVAETMLERLFTDEPALTNGLVLWRAGQGWRAFSYTGERRYT